MDYFLSGCSTDVDPSRAIEQIYDAVFQDDISLVIFFCSQDYSRDALAAQLAKKFAGIEVVGCTSSGGIGKNGYQKQGIVACSFSSHVFEYSAQLVEDVSQFSYHKADKLVSQLKDQFEASGSDLLDSAPANEQHFFSLQFIDGLCLKEETFTQILSTALNGIPLLGGSAGDDLRFERTYIYYQGEFYTNAAVVILGVTRLNFEPFIIQHFFPTEKRLVVTESIPEKRIVTSLNGLPAAMEYARNVGCEVEALDSEVFASHPLLVKIVDGAFVRSIQKVNDDGSLTFYCAIDDGIVLSLGKGEDIVKNLDRELARLKSKVGDLGLIIGFDCIFRYLELEQLDKVDQVSEIFKQVGVIGFNSYGEQYCAMHVNQTLTGIAFSSEALN